MTTEIQRAVGSLLTVNQAAAFLSCTPAALERWRRERRGPPYLKIGRLVRYTKRDLVTWLRSKRIFSADVPTPVKNMFVHRCDREKPASGAERGERE
jgi:hypothetical protein